MKYMLAVMLVLTLGVSSPVGTLLGPHPVTLETADGISIHGWYIHPGPHNAVNEADPEFFAQYPAVVMLHMYRGAKDDWGPLFGLCYERGVAVLAIDMRGHGESITGHDKEDLSERVRKRDSTLFNAMWQDAAAAVDWLVAKGHHKERIGLLGASVGCSVAIDAARRDPGLRVVGTLAPGANYLGVDTLAHLTDWEDRSLLIVSSEEEWPQGAKQVHMLLVRRPGMEEGTAAKRPDLWLLSGTGGEVHGTRVFGRVEGIEDRLLDWFEAQLIERDETAADDASERRGRR